MLLSLLVMCFLWTLSLKFKGTSFSGPRLIEIPEIGTQGRNIHQDMGKRGIIGLKIDLFIPTLTTHHQVQQKAVPPLQLEIEGEVPTPLGLLEAGVAGGSDCLCPRSCLSSFWQVWETKNPPLTNYPAIRSKYLNREKQEFLIKEVYPMIDKITPLQKVTSLGFYNRLFLVPKPGKKWRPVIDLSVVNKYLHIPTFKMETTENIRASLQQGEWVTSRDLTDAYFHIPIHPRFQKCLRFDVGDRSYQFTALLFGIATAALEFTMVAKEVKLTALTQGIRIHQYIDDWLMRAKTKHQCHENTHRLIHLVQSLGWIINFEKAAFIFESMLYGIWWEVDVYVFIIMLNSQINVGSYVFILHVKLTLLLCYSFSLCFVVEVGQVMEVAKSNYLRPTRLNSATVRKW